MIRAALDALAKRSDLSRYTHALTKIVCLSQPDDALKIEWRANLRLLRALLYTSPIGTQRQRAKLLEIARNSRMVAAMRHALQQELEVDPRGIEPTWIAVLYAEGSNASILQADRYVAHLKLDTQATLRAYAGELK